MSIKSYRKDEKVFWKVYVNLRSKKNPALRIQKRVSEIDSLAAAKRIEKNLMLEISTELEQEFGRGLKWKRILEKWQIDAEAGLLRRYDPTTIMDFVAILKKWTGDWLDRPANEFTKADGRDLQKKLEKSGLSISGQRKVRSVVNTVFNYGIEEKLILNSNSSPMAGITINSKEEIVPEVLNLVEIKQFLEAAKHLQSPWYPIWAMALLTGMRNGELYALEWDDIDLENSLLRVSKSYNHRIDTFKSTKAGYWRNVPISNELRKLLIELKSNLKLRDPKDQKFVLPRLGYWNKGLQAKELRLFLKGVGLPSVKFHALRACFATQLLAKNVPPAIVMKICGWKNLKTMEFYVRLAGVNEAGATDGLNIMPNEKEVMDNVVNMFEFKS